MDKKTLEYVTYCIGKLSMLLKMPQQEIYKRLKTEMITRKEYELKKHRFFNMRIKRVKF